MGQKSSILEDSSELSFTSQDSPELAVRSKKSTFADLNEIMKPKLESGDPPLPICDMLRETASLDSDEFHEARDSKADMMGKLLDGYIKEERKSESVNGCFTKTCLNPNFLPLLDNPSIAELSQLTALKMMQNLEEFAKLDQFWKSQVGEDDKITDDNVSEKDFRTIDYEDLPTIQLVDNKISLKQDSSTITNEEIKNTTEIDTKDNKFVPEKLCKTNQTSMVDEDEARSERELTTSNYLVERNDVKHMNLGNESVEEMIQLRSRLSRLEIERDEAMLKMKLAEERCEACEAESKCLEATLGVMEEKLRDMVTELNEEVKKNKGLEQHLTESLQEETFSKDHIETLTSVE